MKISINPILRCLIILAGLISALPGHSQDRHFSQLYANPLYLSPGLTGAFQGNYRATALYRDQWRSALESPISTISLSADLNFKIAKTGSKLQNDRVGAGIQFFSDKKEGFDFNTNHIMLFGAYHKSLDPNSRQTLSLGFQGGLVQKNINFSNQTFSDQFHATQGYINPTGENLPVNNFAFGDFALGLNYSLNPTPDFGMITGVAIHHMFTPNISFYRNIPDDELIENENLLNSRFTFFGMLEFGINEDFAILPRIAVSSQTPYFETLVGSNVRLYVNSDRTSAFYIGGWARLTNQLNQKGIESAILSVGMGINEFVIGLSYDTNISGISNHFTKRGTFELSLSLIGSYDNDGIYCPRF